MIFERKVRDLLSCIYSFCGLNLNDYPYPKHSKTGLPIFKFPHLRGVHSLRLRMQSPVDRSSVRAGLYECAKNETSVTFVFPSRLRKLGVATGLKPTRSNKNSAERDL